MQLITPARQPQHLGALVGSTLSGTMLVLAGLVVAYLTVATPLVDVMVPAARAGSNQVAIGLAIWSFALIAGGALLTAGTSRLAAVAMRLRSGGRARTPVARVAGSLPADLVIATGVVPIDGRPIPELVIGPFGVAVVHEMAPSDRVRRVGDAWEIRLPEGWAPTEDPRDGAARDAERVRHWLTHGDLEFVVRVYGAVVTSETSLPRTPTCAVITEDQIAGWLEALPAQRSLNTGRQGRLASMVRSAVASREARRGR
jgi:hypothetical protein